MASWQHAEVRPRSDGRHEVVDQSSHHGTFVNGQSVTKQVLEESDVVEVGRHSCRVTNGNLEVSVDTGEVAYAAVDLGVRLPRGKVLLDRVNFSLKPCSLLGIIGPSGCGKSTLMNALTGLRMATEGDVLYDGQSFYSSYHALRRRVGFVPQADLVHEGLTVRQELEYSAELRFPPDTEVSARERRVQEVIAELGLDDCSDVCIRQLSGGQRKRVSVGLELLVEPSLLFLDEPTSGLDPHYESSLMEILRELANNGRTVIVVTHSVQSLGLCDRILVMAPGGQVAYFGPPDLVSEYFDRPDYPQIFDALDRPTEGDWGERFRGHPYFGDYVDVDEEMRELALSPTTASGKLAASGGVWTQFRALTRRYLAILAADRRNLGLVLLQAPLLGVLLLVALPSKQLGSAPPGEFRLISQASLVLLVIVLGVTWLGMSNAVREIAKELPLYQRERAAGLSIAAYVASKAFVLGLITAVQAIVLIGLAVALQQGPGGAVLLGWPVGELMVVGVLTGFAAMALGLLISAVTKTSDRATTVLPIVLVFELVLALGGLFPQIGNKPVLRQLGYISSARWGFAASASTADLNHLQYVSSVFTRVPSVDLTDPTPLFREFSSGAPGDASFDHTVGTWTLDTGLLIIGSAVALLGTGLVLRRYDPVTRAA